MNLSTIVAVPAGADETTPSGNRTAFGRRLTVADWRQLPALLSEGRSTLDMKRRVALLDASRQLDAWLSCGPSAYDECAIHRVEVFGVLSYARIDGSSPEVRGEFRDMNGKLLPLKVNFSLLPALKGVWWLGVVLDAWGVPWRSEPPLSPEPADEQERRVLSILRRMLDADVRFRRLRAELAQLVLGDELLSLAVRSRIPLLDKWHVNLVMTYRAVYEEVARVHPKLLPLLTLWLRDFGPLCRQMVKDGKSPAQMFSDFRRLTVAGMPSRSWTWLVRNGLGFLVSQPHVQVRFIGVRELLREFMAIGLKSPPPARLVRSWLALNGRNVKAGWAPIPVSVRRVLVREAHARKTLPGFDGWCKDAQLVMFATTDPAAPFREVPKGAGWKWLKARVALQHASDDERHAFEGLSWKSPIGTLKVLGMTVTPLTSGAAMFHEGVYMHSCLSDHIGPCDEGKELVVSVRDANGKPAANISFVRDRAEGRDEAWSFRECKARFNREPSAGMYVLAKIVEQVLRASDFTGARRPNAKRY